ncbi:hypothetical protein RHMOL_Rhmol11G0037500 [Rhododendron molle]|uniref:Uncharacterized protein n=1 Tax=Rhododendron molle TaxID=49168 RepID=A0ACC0LNL2_RHOML|nr:hypothetical protein RHMOL_Rhmol11G0037500 [Rhododendron molle]
MVWCLRESEGGGSPRYGYVDVQVDEDDDSYEYDLDSDTSDEDEDEVFYGSDYGLTDDDELFEQNVDRDVEFGGLNKKNTLSIDADYAAVIEDMADIESGIDDSFDELNSGHSSSDEERGSRKQERKYTVFNEKTEMDNPVSKVGMEFKTHDLFANGVKEYSIIHGKKIKFLKNDREKVRVKCQDGCDWLIYASYVPSDAVYRVKRIRSNPTWPSKSLAETIEKERTVKVSIQKVYRAMQMALELIQGSAEEQFQQLWGYVEEVRSSNLGTTIKMKVKLNTGSGNFAKFKRLYICWGALKKGFLEGCRPLIGLDGCHLKGPQGGILLTVYPFAYAVVDTYLRTYNNLINPINGRDLWPTTENPTLLPPNVKKRVGRPNKAGGSNVGSMAGAQGSGQIVRSGGGTMRNTSSGQCNGQTRQMNATSKQENTRRPKLAVKKTRKVNQSEGGSIVVSK